MDNSLPWSRIIGILAVIGQIITLALHFATGLIPTDVQVILTGVLAGISAITERVTGGASKV